mmetsp:Transcript_14220/g.40714  ORF Transcript_14220/g.40714 Transcript_14220/m.40714 type:complete len:211 (-) Transcript_14220:606-1238(-)
MAGQGPHRLVRDLPRAHPRTGLKPRKLFTGTELQRTVRVREKSSNHSLVLQRVERASAVAQQTSHAKKGHRAEGNLQLPRMQHTAMVRRPAPPFLRILPHRTIPAAGHVADDAVEEPLGPGKPLCLVLRDGQARAAVAQDRKAAGEHVSALSGELVGDHETPFAKALRVTGHALQGLHGFRSGRRAHVQHPVLGPHAKDGHWHGAHDLLS